MGQGKDALRTVKQGLVALRQMAGNKIYEAPTNHGKKRTVRCCLFSGGGVKMKRRFQKVTEVVVLKVFHMWIVWEDFWLSIICSKRSEWTSTLIDNISTHNHGTPAYMNITSIYYQLLVKDQPLQNITSQFPGTFWDSMRYHCFIPWWAPVSWDMTPMKLCVCAPRTEAGKRLLGCESLFATLLGLWVSKGEFSFCKWDW